LSKNCLLKHIIERKIGGGIEVTRRRGERHKQLLDTFRKREGTGNWKRKQYIALFVQLVLEKIIHLSKDRLRI